MKRAKRIQRVGKEPHYAPTGTPTCDASAVGTQTTIVAKTGCADCWRVLERKRR